jgi:multidrug efflux pump subunit AcrB
MDSQIQVERMTPAIFPVFILSMTGSLPTAELYDYATYVVKPELARVPGAGAIENLASDTREIEVILDPAKMTAAGLTVVDVSDALTAENQLVPVGRFQQSGLQNLSLASGLWTTVDDIANAPVLVKNGATVRVRDVGMVAPGAPDRTMLITGNGREAVSISIAQQIGANILDLKRGVDETIASLAKSLARRHPHQPRLRPRRIRRTVDRQRARRHPHRRRPCRHRPARLPAGLAADDDRGDHPADGRDPDVRLPLAVRRDHQPDVARRPRRRHRPRH